MNHHGVALLGAGNVAKAHLEAIQDTEGAELVAIGGRNFDRTKAWMDEQGVNCEIYTQIDELLADDRVEIVIITTPNHQHAQQTIKAAQAGKHILDRETSGAQP